MAERPSSIAEEDFIGDVGLAAIGELVEKMPRSFDLVHMQASARGVTLTVHFPTAAGPFANQGSMERLLSASMLTECLYRNLVGERAARESAERMLDKIITGGG